MKKQPRKYTKNSINQSLAKATGYYDRFIVDITSLLKKGEGEKEVSGPFHLSIGRRTEVTN